MKKRLIPAALCALAAACTSSGALYESGNPPAVRMAASEIVRNPSPTNLDGIPAGKVKWNYTTGLELLAIADAGRMYGIEEFTAYAERYFDTIVRPGGEVLTYKKTKYNLDHVCPGRALFELYDRTGDVRYKMALDTLYAQLQEQPRNADGGFWHKKVYPHQMWLDGLYMAQPFYAEYAARNLSGAGRSIWPCCLWIPVWGRTASVAPGTSWSWRISAAFCPCTSGEILTLQINSCHAILLSHPELCTLTESVKSLHLRRKRTHEDRWQ